MDHEKYITFPNIDLFPRLTQIRKFLGRIANRVLEFNWSGQEDDGARPLDPIDTRPHIIYVQEDPPRSEPIGIYDMGDYVNPYRVDL